ncbi:MAG: FMN-binding glutamate synthase family protein, partial [Thermoleophilia bacterium]|nr:FMN-binding glutamate synthase family protein [Thermoleophilia bacterium]
MQLTLALLASLVLLLLIIAVRDVLQKEHTILRNFPILGHFRYWLESVGPELRQYIVSDSDQERPFSRNQRRWIYASAKQQNNYYGFGTDKDLERGPNQMLIRQVPFPLDEPGSGQIGSGPTYDIPCAKVLGARHGRTHSFRPASIVNVSGMSFGALSAPAVEAMNRGAKLAGCFQNTGEGGLTSYHQQGGDLIFQVGTGYFGVRDAQGRFSLDHLDELVHANPIR